ncbi:MAG: hypothetical protein ACXWEW_11905 [Nitrososphaeraceae archaeon]
MNEQITEEKSCKCYSGISDDIIEKVVDSISKHRLIFNQITTIHNLIFDHIEKIHNKLKENEQKIDTQNETIKYLLDYNHINKS